jgi:hypothetical protein
VVVGHADVLPGLGQLAALLEIMVADSESTVTELSKAPATEAATEE